MPPQEPPPLHAEIAVGAHHSLVDTPVVNGLTGALRVSRGPWTAELGGFAAFSPADDSSVDETIAAILGASGQVSPIRTTTDRFAVHVLADLGVNGPDAGDGGGRVPGWEGDRAAWAGPHLLLGLGVRDLAVISRSGDVFGEVTSAVTGTALAYGPVVGVGLAGGYGPVMSGRLVALARVDLPGADGLGDPDLDIRTPAARTLVSLQLDVLVGVVR